MPTPADIVHSKARTHLSPLCRHHTAARCHNVFAGYYARGPKHKAAASILRLKHSTRYQGRLGRREVQAIAGATDDGFVQRASSSLVNSLHSVHDQDIITLAIPALGSILLDPLMSLVDTALVGRLGSAPLAAVGLSGILFSFGFVCFNFLLFLTTPKVAAAVAQDDRKKASEATAQGLWVALIAGVLLGLLIWFASPVVVARMTEPAVAVHAVTYLRCRCLAAPALLGVYVATGSFRGHKNTRTPLFASVVSNLVNLGLDIVLMFGLGWGVAGAAIATSISQYVTFGILYAKMRTSEMLYAVDVRGLPSREAISPLLMSGLSLSARSLTVMGTYVFATTLVSSIGSTALAAHEILRQAFILSMQFFTALDISAQALVAAYLGRGNRSMARDVLLRCLQVAVVVGLVLGMVILLFRHSIPTIFTQDPEVAAWAAATLPILAFMMPLDATAAVMDGGLLGASETAWVSRASVLISMLVLAGLVLSRRLFPGSLFSLWVAMKIMTIGRVISGSIRYSSPNGPLGIVAKQASS